MERLSINNRDLRKSIDEVVSRVTLASMSQQESSEKSINEIIESFWEEFKHFTYGTGPNSYQSSCFENDNALSGQSYLWHKIHSLH